MNDHGVTALDTPILRAQGLVKHYSDGNVQALRGVSLEIAAAESVAITGPSGCGKSTLLHLLGGLDRPTSGEVYFRGKALAKLDIDHFRAHEVGFVFQSFYLMPTLTALENIQIPMFEGRWPPHERRQRAERLIDEVGLSDRRSHRPGQLSVGERQRVAIARALANDPCLLLADEPTGNLDSKSQDEILDLLHRLRDQRPLTLVIVTHSHEVAQAADRRIPMKDGMLQPA
ncbi:MAG: ABC transporter ATP-binding protein [Isosphaerales bacterium]